MIRNRVINSRTRILPIGILTELVCNTAFKFTDCKLFLQPLWFFYREMINQASKEIPYVFSVPETYEELTGIQKNGVLSIFFSYFML